MLMLRYTTYNRLANFCQTNQLSELESFVASNKNTQLQTVGDACFSEDLFEAARVVFNAIGNWPRLVSCLVKLKNFSAAIEAARKVLPLFS